MDNRIIALVGFSGAGKDTLANVLKSVGFNFVVSHSTRPMRPNESERNPYYFIDNNKLLELFADEQIIETRKYNSVAGTWYYALHKDEIQDDKQYVIVVDLLGAEKLKAYFGNRILPIFIEAADETRKQRCIVSRDFDSAEWERRLLDDKTRFTDEYISSVCNYTVINENLLSASIELFNILKQTQSEQELFNAEDKISLENAQKFADSVKAKEQSLQNKLAMTSQEVSPTKVKRIQSFEVPVENHGFKPL